MLYYETEQNRDGDMMVIHDGYGRYMCGDLVLGEPSLETAEDGSPEDWEVPAPTVTVDGHGLHPLIPYYNLPDRVVGRLRQRILFP